MRTFTNRSFAQRTFKIRTFRGGDVIPSDVVPHDGWTLSRKDSVFILPDSAAIIESGSSSGSGGHVFTFRTAHYTFEAGRIRVWRFNKK